MPEGRTMEERERRADGLDDDERDDPRPSRSEPAAHVGTSPISTEVREKRVMASADRVMRKHRNTFAALAK
ncbi:hypothetical protein [Lichenifustis flavocetrariae]|uniref:Uncharacterized protein n=1 Tax=Lichenifustis flavocetrariae TaxID=2949735 RepID=A0AA42CNC4_9HYPH|nr:hypothetical protein [Lichenifustis flavocetrariae]MCW6512616.1 hypothetical protein [Lichenifustis flavocetrariae]